MSGCSCHVETIAPLVMMSNYQNEAEIRDHVFGKEPLRPPPTARCQIACAAICDRRSAVAPTWAGKPMPRGTGFPARGFGTEPPCARPSSALRFLRSLLSKILPCVPWANPPPSVLRRPPLLPRGASTKDRRVCPLFQSLSFSAFLFFTYRNSGVTKPASKKWRSVVNTVCRRISLIITMLEQSTNE